MLVVREEAKFVLSNERNIVRLLFQRQLVICFCLRVFFAPMVTHVWGESYWKPFNVCADGSNKRVRVCGVFKMRELLPFSS